jgi:hypothetical protein
VWGTSTPIAIGEEIQLRLRIPPAGGHECVIDGQVVRTSTGLQNFKPWFTVVTATTPGVEFRWIDIVD